MTVPTNAQGPDQAAMFAQFQAFLVWQAGQEQALVAAPSPRKPASRKGRGKAAPKKAAPAAGTKLRKIAKESRVAFVVEHEWALGLSTLEIVAAAVSEPEEFPIGEGWTISSAYVQKALLGTWEV